MLGNSVVGAVEQYQERHSRDVNWYTRVTDVVKTHKVSHHILSVGSFLPNVLLPCFGEVDVTVSSTFEQNFVLFATVDRAFLVVSRTAFEGVLGIACDTHTFLRKHLCHASWSMSVFFERHGASLDLSLVRKTLGSSLRMLVRRSATDEKVLVGLKEHFSAVGDQSRLRVRHTHHRLHTRGGEGS